ncbi:unnamed protein product [Durusdinium trenchii]|uniref:HhH-GPD domain-containing protein n=1 Tax=Durusdinium trenchii TaxID=1381693 RepID=A0ABP0PQF6_9DINO
MEEHIELIKELRKDRSAPVDSMGVRAIHNTSKDSYETLVALILSTRTKDSATYETIQVLRHHGLTPLNILKTPALTLTSLLAKVNHRNRKASYLREMSEMLMNNFGGRVPDQEWQLRKLKGVGEKSALLYLQTVTGKVTGIAVDAHLHSIANWLSWVETKRPHQTRKKLEQRLPRTLWGPINPLVVGFGQELAREKQKILHKCLRSSNPSLALQMLCACGMDVRKQLAKGGMEVEDEILRHLKWTAEGGDLKLGHQTFPSIIWKTSAGKDLSWGIVLPNLHESGLMKGHTIVKPTSCCQLELSLP